MIRFPRALSGVATALALLTAPAQALDLSTMSEAERAIFGAEVRAYLLENPEVIIEAVNLLEQRQAQTEATQDEALVAANLEELQNDGYSWVGGNLDGDITLVEFMDYRCGYCRRAAPEVAQLLAEDGNIRLVIKEFPILGEASMMASRFAVATRLVAGDKAYKQVHDALIEFGGDPNDVSLRRLSEELGLDADAIMAQMDSPEITQELAQTRALAQRMKISGTPTFVLQSELLRGYLPADQMSVIIAEMRDQRG
ncbi:disulfide bond formation protein DsbA [Rhodobacterales bacterium 56_14_T64]|nr:disulfide bond formation protein DsbA [Rhodobacterales bacterium 56_14_T64]